MGIANEGRGDLNWKTGKLAYALKHDHAIMEHPIGKAIARDTAFVIAAIQESGYVIPWNKLKIPETTPTIVHERAHATMRDQAKWAKLVRRDRIIMARNHLDEMPQSSEVGIQGTIVRNDIERLAEFGGPRAKGAVESYRKLVKLTKGSTSVANTEVTLDLGRALIATFAELAVTDLPNAETHFKNLETISKLSGMSKEEHQDILPVSELRKAVASVPAFRKALAALEKNGEGKTAIAEAYRGWIAQAEKSGSVE